MVIVVCAGFAAVIPVGSTHAGDLQTRGKLTENRLRRHNRKERLKAGLSVRDRSSHADSNDAHGHRVHQSFFLLGARFPANTAGETGIRSSIRQKKSFREPPMVSTAGCGTIYGNQRSTEAADWQRLAIKNLGRPVMG
jgi:hypothetical protein